MAYPPAYTRTFSFTDYEVNFPGEPKPGDKLDTEYDNVANALLATQNALALIQRADGQLANGSVGEDQLDPDLFDGIADDAVADAEAAAAAAAASASAAAGAATSASASATTSATAAGVASGAAAQAGVSQGIAQDAANDAALSATDADNSADVSVQAANDTAGSVAACEAHVQRSFEWAELLTGPVLPAPPGWPEAVDDGMFSSKWWAIRAREYNSTDVIDLGTAGADIGEAFDIWDAIPGNDLGVGQTYATWGTPTHTYILIDRSNPSDPNSWEDITGGPGPPNVLTIGTVTTGAPGAPAAASITGTSPAQVLNLTIPEGEQGIQGIQGDQGPQGIPGSVGTILTDDSRVTGEWRFDPTLWVGHSDADITAIKLMPGVYSADAFEAAHFLGRIKVDRVGANGSLTGTRVNGAFNSPTPLLADQAIFAISARGSADTSVNTATTGLIQFTALADWSTTSAPGAIDLYVTPPGSTAVGLVARFTSATTTIASASTTITSATLGRVLDINSAAASGPYVTFMRSGTPFADIGNGAQVGGTLDGIGIATRGATPIVFVRNGSTLSGRFTGTGEFQVINGTAALPSYSFISNPDTGMYRAGVNTIGFAGGGVRGMQIDGGHVYFEDGSVGLPAITFNSDFDTGFWRRGSGDIAISINGALGAVFSATQNTFVLAPVYHVDGTAGAPGMSFNNDTDTGVYRSAGNNEARLVYGGIEGFGWSASGVFTYLPLYARDGTAAAPALTFRTDVDTGLYRPSSDVMSVSAGGMTMVQFFGTGATAIPRSLFSAIISIQDGVVGQPAIAFENNLTTGFYREASNTVCVAIGGFRAVRFGTDSGVAGRVTINSNGSTTSSAITVTNDGVANYFIVRADGAVTGTSFTTTSSHASKRETGKPAQARDILSRLRPILYRLLAGADNEQLGLVAEEVHDVCPQLSDGKSVAYDRLAILLLAAWQDEHMAEAA